jgi:hypothetical protein
MPIERGSAIRKTTTEGGTSFTIARSLPFSAAIPGSFDLHAVARGSYSTGGGAGDRCLFRHAERDVPSDEFNRPGIDIARGCSESPTPASSNLIVEPWRVP